MITSVEVARAIQGSWRLARFDASGLTFFGDTVDDFWRSFWAAVFVAPAHFLITAIVFQLYETDAGSVRFFAFHAVAYVIGWTAFPLVMFYLTRLMDRSDAYLRYIVAYNWSALLQVAILFPLTVLALPDQISTPADGGAPASLTISMWALVRGLAHIYVLVFVGFIAKSALRIATLLAVGIVTLDFALSHIIIDITNGLALS